MSQIIRLKQIESGAAIAAAVALAHPAALLTNNAAPFAFNAGTQVGNVPQEPTVSVLGNQLTFTPGDGSPPVVYTPTFAADVFLQSGTYNVGTGNLELTLNDSTVVTVPLSALVPISTAGSQTITFAGDGTPGTPLTAQAVFDPAGNNLAVNAGSGILVALNTLSNAGITFTGDGTVGNPLTATVNFVATVAADSETVKVRGNGSVSTPFKFDVKLQPDDEGTLNFLHKAGALAEDDDTHKGLGYTKITVLRQGIGPFDITSEVTSGTTGWSTTPEVVKIEGFVNGVYYSNQETGAWDYTNPAAISWGGVISGGLFDLEAGPTPDSIKFDVHIRAV